jgi:hypothetical protein
MKKLVFSLIGVAIATMAMVNVNLNSQNDLSDFSLANVEALTVEQTVYKWSNEIDCPGAGNGDYQVCQVGGTQNSCTNPGGTTCNCGSNKNWNNDGNCD